MLWQHQESIPVHLPFQLTAGGHPSDDNEIVLTLQHKLLLKQISNYKITST